METSQKRKLSPETKEHLIAAAVIAVVSLVLIFALTGGHPWRIAEPPVGAYINITPEEAELLRAGCTLPPDTNAVIVTAAPEVP